jgi:hypothetical protein
LSLNFYIFIVAAQFAQLSPLPAFTKPGQHRLTTEGANFASIAATVAEGGDVSSHFPNYFLFICFKNQ